ncbi:MAG: hypothetical protein GY865_16780, partial [candidate division Zixibacteria bacterium]|nr:hypothetical protein [candidate division Zixibacteria bacterium]
QQAKIYFETAEEFNQLKTKYLDIVGQQDDYLEVVIFPEELEELSQAGFGTEVVIDDMTAFFQSRLDPTRDMGGYKTLDEINAYVDQMILDHPDLVSAKFNMGLSLEGRPMWAVKISDNPNVDEDEPEVLYTAATHCREMITPEVLFYFMNYLTNNYGTDPEATFLVDNREMWFIPVFNVDGYHYNGVTNPAGGGMWRKNRRNNGDGTFGVDLNRNWGLGWGYNDGGSSPNGIDETYRGTGPFSEPETQNVRDFIIDHEFVIVMDYHAYTNIYYLPYGYNSSMVPDHPLISAICDSMGVFNNYGHAVMGINGCSSDWEYGEQTLKNKNLAILPEVGNASDNFWPPLERIPYLVSVNLEPNKLIAYLAGEPNMIYPPQVPEITLPETVSTVEYNVEWNHVDEYNEADQFELIEYRLEKGIVDPGISLEYYQSEGFTISEARYHSAPSSFHSGTRNDCEYYFQTVEPYEVLEDDVVEFWTYYDIQERYDYAYFEISTDGITFTPLPGDITTNYNPNGLNRGNGITGMSDGWEFVSFDISDYTGQSVYFKFSYETDVSIVGEGIFIDDIFPSNGFVSQSIISSSIADTFYTFTDHEAGSYYYKVKAMDKENQWSGYSEMVSTL